MSEFYITKHELWIDAVDTAESLKYKLGNLERSHDKLTPGERKAIAAMKRKIAGFISYGLAAQQLLNPAGRNDK